MGTHLQPRSIEGALQEFAEQKFVLVSGPRQVGKTTLARAWLNNFEGVYLNWDDPSDRAVILGRDFLFDLAVEAVVLDEFHKYGRWKNWLKGGIR